MEIKMETVKVPESPNIYGIEETKDAVIFLTSLANAITESLADGGITLSDYPKFIKPVTKLFPAISGINQVPRELEDLKEDEKAELVELVKNELNVNANVEEIVAQAIDIAFEIKVLADLIQNSK
jgi:hypothetical protein